MKPDELPISILEADHLRSILKTIPNEITTTITENNAILVYLPCKNNTCDHSQFFEAIRNHLLTTFTLSYAEIIDKLSIKSDIDPEFLFKKAIRKLSKHTAQGELGELILFTIIELYLNAPKIVSKISLKTARRMPVFGADAIHAQFVDGQLRIYLGESKLHESFKNAATSAVASIAKSTDGYSDEFYIIDSHISYKKMTDTQRREIISLLNPFLEPKLFQAEMLHTPCFIGFSAPHIFSEKTEEYINRYISTAKEYISDFYSKLEAKKCPPDRTALMILPFTSIEALTEEFVSYMGIQE